MLFPWFDLRFAGFPVAEVIMPNGQVRFFKIKLVHNNYFFVKYNSNSGGIFKLDRSKRIPFYKTAIYHYDARSQNPLDLRVMKEILHFAQKNKLHRIRQKDVANGEKLRRAFGTKKKDKKEIESIKQKLKQEGITDQDELNKRVHELMKGEGDTPGLKIMNDTQESDWILDNFPLFSRLVEDELLTEDQAISFAEKIEKGEMTFDAFAEEFNRLKIFDLDTQISTDAQLFLEDYKSLNPSEPYQYMKMSKTAKKGFDDMASGSVKPAIPIMGIIMVILVLIVGVPVVLNNVDLSNTDGLMNALPSPPPFLSGNFIASHFLSIFGR